MRDKNLNYIEKDTVLTISLGHISKEAAEFLDRENDKKHFGVEVYKKQQNSSISKGEGIYGHYGYIIYLKSIFDNNLETRIHMDLINLCNYAADLGCTILCLDPFGKMIPYFPFQNWIDDVRSVK